MNTLYNLNNHKSVYFKPFPTSSKQPPSSVFAAAGGLSVAHEPFPGLVLSNIDYPFVVDRSD